MTSLCCDGLFNNYSELIMKKYRISQDQYKSSVYSVAFVLVLIATIVKGELVPGFQKMFLLDGTIQEIDENKIGFYHHHREFPTYTKGAKLFVFFLFTFTGLFGSSCAGAITKTWGALRMSVTSTVRKAGTLFLSMAAPGFHNKCTPEHIIGICVFISALFVKSFHKKFDDSSFVKRQKTKGSKQDITEVQYLSPTRTSTSSSFASSNDDCTTPIGTKDVESQGVAT